MDTFEAILAGCAVAIAFVKVWDWVEWQLSLREKTREEQHADQ